MLGYLFEEETIRTEEQRKPAENSSFQLAFALFGRIFLTATFLCFTIRSIDLLFEGGQRGCR
jgi:hypothetical protein